MPILLCPAGSCAVRNINIQLPLRRLRQLRFRRHRHRLLVRQRPIRRRHLHECLAGKERDDLIR